MQEMGEIFTFARPSAVMPRRAAAAHDRSGRRPLTLSRTGRAETADIAALITPHRIRKFRMRDTEDNQMHSNAAIRSSRCTA